MLKKINIEFSSKKLDKKDVFSVYEYEGFYIVNFQFYTTLSYNFGQQSYGGFKTTWGIFNKETHKLYTTKNTRKECKIVIDRLLESGKTFEELEGKEYFRIVQMK